MAEEDNLHLAPFGSGSESAFGHPPGQAVVGSKQRRAPRGGQAVEQAQFPPGNAVELRKPEGAKRLGCKEGTPA